MERKEFNARKNFISGHLRAKRAQTEKDTHKLRQRSTKSPPDGKEQIVNFAERACAP
jgi:hypothetical protein